tara:strand:- start:7102 stop:7575 length:474 start_codon:yes stop_codon:yes gene_type:complete
MKITDLKNKITKEKYNDISLHGSKTLWKKDIYLVKRSQGWYKIGVSNNVNNRVYQMQSYSPEKLSYITSVPLQGMVFYVERKVLEKFRKHLDPADISGEWVRLQGDVKEVSNTFTKVVNKVVSSIRRKYVSDYRAIEKLIESYEPNYKHSNAIRIIK